MKNFIYLLTLTSALSLTSCGNDDSKNTNDPAYAGRWALVNVSGGFAGIDDDIEGVIWNFDPEENTVTITNNNPDDMDEDFFDNGTYDMSIEEGGTNCSHNLTIDTIEFGCIDINGNTMTVEQPDAEDDYTLTFEKVTN